MSASETPFGRPLQTTQCACGMHMAIISSSDSVQPLLVHLQTHRCLLAVPIMGLRRQSCRLLLPQRSYLGEISHPFLGVREVVSQSYIDPQSDRPTDQPHDSLSHSQHHFLPNQQDIPTQQSPPPRPPCSPLATPHASSKFLPYLPSSQVPTRPKGCRTASRRRPPS